VHLLQEGLLGHRHRCAAFTWIPSPQHQRRVHVLFDSFRVTAAIALRVYQQFAQLPVRQFVPDHWVIQGRQMPSGCTRRHVRTLQIVILVTGAALHRRRADTVWSTPDIHDVSVQIVTLPWVVARGVAHDATRMPQRGHDSQVGRHSRRAASLGIRRQSLRDSVWRNQVSRQ
jgi:hypothetical protein